MFATGFKFFARLGYFGALLHNNNQKFICKNVHLRAETNKSLIMREIEPGSVLKIPIAHGEGRFHADAETLSKLQANDQVLFRYCDEEGKVNDGANPNGSVTNIAGVCNEKRNVFGMMPHPERAADDELSNTDGRKLFESILSLVEA